MILQKTEDKAKRVLMMSRTQKKMQMQMMILQKVGEEVEDKPDVLELFHPDLPPVTGTTITIHCCHRHRHSCRHHHQHRHRHRHRHCHRHRHRCRPRHLLFSVTVGQTPATARRSMTVTTTIGWSSDDKMVKTQEMIRRLLVTFGDLTLVI